MCTPKQTLLLPFQYKLAMADNQFIFSSSWLPSPRFEIRTLAGYKGWDVKRLLLVPVFFSQERGICVVVRSIKLIDHLWTETRIILHRFLGAFAKLRKATVSFVISVRVRLSVRIEQLGSHWTDFHEI